MTRILVFGDSIARGKDDPTKGWVPKLQQYVFEKYRDETTFHPVYNLGIDGETSEQLLRRIEVEIKARLWVDESTVLVCIGVNDSAYKTDKGDNWVPLDEFRGNIHKAVTLACSLVNKVILVGPTPVDEIKASPASFDSNLFYTLDSLERYDTEIRRLAEDEGLAFVSILEAFKKQDWRRMLEDGVHPNDDGHQKIFEIVRDELESRGII